MRLLYVGTLPPHQGGTAVLASLLLPRLAALDVDVHVISPCGPDEQAARNFDQQHPELHTVRFAMPFLETSPDQPAPPHYRNREESEIRRLFTAGLAHSPQVVVIGRETFVWPVAELAKNAGLPSVLLVQGATTWGMLDGSLPAERTHELLREYARVSQIVTVAEHLRERVAEQGFPAVHLPNPVNLEQFQPRPRCPTLAARLSLGGGPVLLHASNFKHLKRAMDLVEAAPAILAEFPDTTLLFVGDGPALPEVREACSRAGLSSRTRFSGWVDHAQMCDYYSLCDLVVMPSQNEGMALVYLEAMACGRVVVASDIAAARELFSEGDDGVLFRLGQPDSLAKAICRTLANRTALAEMGEMARAKAASRSLSVITARYLHLLRQVAAIALPG